MFHYELTIILRGILFFFPLIYFFEEYEKQNFSLIGYNSDSRTCSDTIGSCLDHLQGSFFAEKKIAGTGIRSVPVRPYRYHAYAKVPEKNKLDLLFHLILGCLHIKVHSLHMDVDYLHMGVDSIHIAIHSVHNNLDSVHKQNFLIMNGIDKKMNNNRM